MPRPRVVRAKPGSSPRPLSAGEKLGKVASSKTGGKRNRLTIELEGKMADLYDGSISVADMDNEELARMQFKASDGTFRGRKPNNLPQVLVNMMRKELTDRLGEKRRSVLEEMHEIIISIARHGDKDGDRLKAAQELLNRELGKTPEKVELSTGDKPFEVDMVRSIRMKRPTRDDS